MTRSLKITAAVLIAGLASPALGIPATTNSVEIVPVDNTDVLTGFNTFDLLMTTPDSDWTSAEILLELSAGSIYQAALGGVGPTPSDFFSLAPGLEFDTYVGVPGGNIAGWAGDIGGRENGKAEVSTSRLDVAFYNIDKTNIGTFSIGRITLSDDAVGDWSLISLTADRQRIDLVGTITKGEVTIDAEASAAASLAFYLNSEEYQRTLPLPTIVPKNTVFVSHATPVVFSPELNNPSADATLPEPGSVALLGLGGLALLRRG